MIARLFLLLVACVGVTVAVDGLKVNSRFSGPPDSVSLADIQAPGQNLPRFVHIDGAEPGDGICLTTTWSKGEEKTSSNESYVPLLDAAQSSLLSQGKTAVVNVFAKSSGCKPDSSLSPLQGVLSDDSVDSTVRDKFKEINIVVGDHPLLLDPMYAPRSSLGNVFILVGSLLAGVAAIVPFFKREKWPKEKELETLALPAMIEALHPALQINMGTNWGLDQKSSDMTERVLLKVNCVNSSKHPSFAILTNRRYLLYRTSMQLGLSVLKGIGRALEKVPVFGGLIAMLLEPFEETYEIILSPEDKRFHETMGYDDRAILMGKVPWHKTCEIALPDIPRRSGSLKIEKKFWSPGVKVLFISDSLKGVFKTPSDFTILQESSFLPISRLIESLTPTFAAHGCVVQQGDGKIDISWKHTDS